MPYRIEWEEHGVLMTFAGTVTADELNASNDELYSDPRFDRLRYQIADFLAIERISLEIDDVIGVSFKDLAAARTTEGVKVALVMVEPELLKLGAAYKELVKRGTWQAEIFSDQGQARAWLAED